jgi:hypothetical protein
VPNVASASGFSLTFILIITLFSFSKTMLSCLGYMQVQNNFEMIHTFTISLFWDDPYIYHFIVLRWSIYLPFHCVINYLEDKI